MALAMGLALAVTLGACGSGGSSSKHHSSTSTSAAGGGSTGGGGGGSSDGASTARPTVLSITPTNAAGSIDVGSTVIVTFSRAIDPATVTSATFTLTPQGGSAVAASVSASGSSATLTPSSVLQYATAYTVSLSTGIADPDGYQLIAYQSSFTTVAQPGTPGGQPTVTAVTPANGAANVPVSSTITVTLSSPVTVGSVTSSSFTLSPSGGSAVGATVAYDGNVTATLTPSSTLAADQAYTVQLSSAIVNSQGQTLVPFQSAFHTAATPDLTPPHVTSITPGSGDTGVAILQTVQVTFSESVSFATLDEATFQVSDGGAAVPGTVVYDDTTDKATFTATAPFGYSTTYTVTLGTGITDLAGNPLDGFSSTFTTTATPDVTPPTVIGRSPNDGTTGVATDTQITALFSEAVDPASVNATTLLVNNGNVAGTVTYNSQTTTAIFTPTAGLANGTTYTVTVTTGVRDLAGNALAADATWQFTTVAAPDTTPPTVTDATPADGSTGVSAGLTLVTATFNEALSAATVNATTFTLSGPSGAVGGTVSYDSTALKATLTLAGSLAASSTYTATLTTGITDLAGNALAAPVAWSFTTAAPTEVIAPGVTQTVNPDGSTSVDVSLTGLDSTQLADAVTTLQNLLDGTLNTSGPLDITLVGDPDNPLSLSVPLIIRRSDVNITVTPSGTITLDGDSATDASGNLINNIVQISGSNVNIDGVNIINGQVSLVTQLGIPTQAVTMQNMVLHDAVSGNCIELHHCSDCTIQNVQAYRCFNKGMDISDVNNITIRNVTIGVGAVDQGPIACNPDDPAQYPTCQFGSNGPRAFAEIYKSTGGTIDGLTVYASRSGSGGTGSSAPDGTPAFGNGLLLYQDAGNFTLKNIVIRDSVLAPTGNTPHGMISVWTPTSAGTIAIDSVTITGNASKAFSFARKSGVQPTITVSNSTVSGNAGIVEVLSSPVNCLFSGDTMDGDPSSFCTVGP